jgi:DNA polymerase-3 subunit alpha
MASLMKYQMIPEDTEEQIMARRVYEFNRYLKAVCKASSEYYKLDERAINFLIEIEKEDLIKTNNFMSVKDWDKKVYQTQMDIFRNWIAKNHDSILQGLNEKIFLEDYKKYAKNGNISAWEMETLCFYYHAHELENVNYYKYGFSNFFDLPEEPEVDRQFTKNGKTVNIFKLHKICGTCIAKNKTKSTVTLLTREGVVEVKFRKEYFSLFDKQISERGADGVKHVVEKSWFNRGSMIVVQGIRSGDNFVAKKYNSSGGHQLYKIDEVFDNGDIRLRSTRYQGDIEEDV